ncbi:MAG: ankyrin repeat domain-containing protein [Proteobacteria bacterium]|nr:ankyrin repeat domain-containing protein [Pseudomonadota bacterium]
MLLDGVLENLIEYLDPLEAKDRPAYEQEATKIIRKYPQILGLACNRTNQITPLIAAVMSPKHCCSQEVFTLLLQNPSNLNAAKDCGRRPIHYLCYANRADYLRQLLAAGDIELNPACHGALYTPLHLAAMGAAFDAMQVLVQTGKANLEAVTNQKQTPLHLACFFGQMRSGTNSPAIAEEVALRYEQTIDVLLAAGAKVNVPDADKRTPLYYLASANIPLEIKQRIMAKLIEHGANPGIVDFAKDNFATFAKRIGQTDFAQMAQESAVPTLRWYCVRAVVNNQQKQLTNIEEIDSALQKMKLGRGK